MATVTWSQLRSEDINNIFFLLPLAWCDDYSLYLYIKEIYCTYNIIPIIAMLEQLILKSF